MRALTIGGTIDFGTGLDVDLGTLDLERLRTGLSSERYPYRKP